MKVQQKTLELVNEIKKTPEFSELKKARDKINRNKNLKNQMDKFQKAQLDLQMADKPPKNLDSILEQMKKNYEAFLKVPDAVEYFKAGKNFNEMMAKTYKLINDSLNSSLTAN